MDGELSTFVCAIAVLVNHAQILDVAVKRHLGENACASSA